MFGKLYLGEIKKQMRPKAIITLAIFFVIFFVLFAVIYNIDIENIISNETITTTDENGETVEMPADEFLQTVLNQSNVFFGVTAENIDERIAAAQSNLNAAKEYDKANKTNTAYTAKSELAVLNYLKENNLSGADVAVEGASNYLGLNTAEGFVSTYFETLVLILSIYGIVMAAGIFADEYKNGTIKLLMMRPITRNQLTLAKLLATYSIVLGYLGIMSLIAYAYGAIAFKNVSKVAVLMVFNGKHILQSTAGGVVMIKMILTAIRLLSLVTASFAIGTILRKKTIGIIASFIIMFGIISMIFTAFKLQILTLSANYNLNMYFSYGGSTMRFGNFYISLAVLVCYWAAMLVSTFLVVQKRDIA